MVLSEDRKLHVSFNMLENNAWVNCVRVDSMNDCSYKEEVLEDKIVG